MNRPEPQEPSPRQAPVTRGDIALNVDRIAPATFDNPDHRCYYAP